MTWIVRDTNDISRYQRAQHDAELAGRLPGMGFNQRSRNIAAESGSVPRFLATTTSTNCAAFVAAKVSTQGLQIDTCR